MEVLASRESCGRIYFVNLLWKIRPLCRVAISARKKIPMYIVSEFSLS
jgi:hypothetical protein